VSDFEETVRVIAESVLIVLVFPFALLNLLRLWILYKIKPRGCAR
jgi:hypothetical protein